MLLLRSVGAAHAAMTQFFTVGGRIPKAALLRSPDGKDVRETSKVCNPCYNAYAAHCRLASVRRREGTTAGCKEQVPGGNENGCGATQRVQAALRSGSLVRGGDVEAWLVESRKEERPADLHPTYLRALVQNMMADIDERD